MGRRERARAGASEAAPEVDDVPGLGDDTGPAAVPLAEVSPDGQAPPVAPAADVVSDVEPIDPPPQRTADVEVEGNRHRVTYRDEAGTVVDSRVQAKASHAYASAAAWRAGGVIQ